MSDCASSTMLCIVHRTSPHRKKKVSLLHSFSQLLYYTALPYLLLCIVHRDSPHQRATTSCFTSCFTGCRHASLSLKRTSRKSTRFTSFTSFTHLITILNSSRFTGFTASQWPLNFVHLERPRRPPPPPPKGAAARPPLRLPRIALQLLQSLLRIVLQLLQSWQGLQKAFVAVLLLLGATAAPPLILIY